MRSKENKGLTKVTRQIKVRVRLWGWWYSLFLTHKNAKRKRTRKRGEKKRGKKKKEKKNFLPASLRLFSHVRPLVSRHCTKKKVGEGEAHGWRREIPGMLILNYQIQLSPKYWKLTLSIGKLEKRMYKTFPFKK